jgi:transketolase
VRQAFVQTLTQLAREDDRVLLLTGDLGFMALEPFRQAFPHRFFNVGVAEQNMVGIATGLAEAGFVPFVYSIAPFAALRPFEFIRNGPVLHHLPVRIVGMGMGFDYGHAGPTHFALEDIGVMRTQPGLCTVIPADSAQAKSAIVSTRQHRGPIYFSLSKDDRAVVPGLDGRFELGRLQRLRAGDDVTLVTMGSLAVEAMKAAQRLQRDGISATVALVSSFHPAPEDDLAKLLATSRRVVTVEAHALSGGVGALVCEVASERGLGVRVRRLAVRSAPDGRSGSTHAMLAKHGLDSDAIVRAVREEVGA